MKLKATFLGMGKQGQELCREAWYVRTVKVVEDTAIAMVHARTKQTD